MFSRIINWSCDRAVIKQLSHLSDRELADLGIGRQDIKAVVRLANTVIRDESTASEQRPFVFAAPAVRHAVEPAPTPYRPASLAA